MNPSSAISVTGGKLLYLSVHWFPICKMRIKTVCILEHCCGDYVGEPVCGTQGRAQRAVSPVSSVHAS